MSKILDEALNSLPGENHNETSGAHICPSTAAEIAAMDEEMEGSAGIKPPKLNSAKMARQLASVMLCSSEFKSYKAALAVSSLLDACPMWVEMAEINKQLESGLITQTEWLWAMLRQFDALQDAVMKLHRGQ